MGSTQRGRRHRRERRLPGSVLGLLGTVGGIAVVLLYRPGAGQLPTADLTIQAQAAAAPAAAGKATGGSAAGGKATSGKATGGKAGSAVPRGLVLGRTVGTDFGDIQVGLTVKAGKVISAVTLKSPHESAQSRRINTHALPILYRQTVAAQTARIDGVSGATVSSVGYRASLQSALDAAHLSVTA